MMRGWGSSSQGKHGVEYIASGGSPIGYFAGEVMHGFKNATEINEDKSFGRWPFLPSAKPHGQHVVRGVREGGRDEEGYPRN